MAQAHAQVNWTHRFHGMTLAPKSCVRCGHSREHRNHRPPYLTPRINWQRIFATDDTEDTERK